MNDGVPNRLTQTIAADPTTTPSIVRNLLPTVLLRAGSVDDRQRLTLQGGVRYDHLTTNYPDSAHRRSRIRGRRPRSRSSIPQDRHPGIELGRRHGPHGRGLRSVRERQDGAEVQPGQVHGSLRGEQQRLRPQSADSHDGQHDARVDRHRTRISWRTATSPTRTRTASAATCRTRASAKRCSSAATIRGSISGFGNRPYNWSHGRLGSAGGRSRASR